MTAGPGRYDLLRLEPKFPALARARQGEAEASKRRGAARSEEEAGNRAGTFPPFPFRSRRLLLGRGAPRPGEEAAGISPKSFLAALVSPPRRLYFSSRRLFIAALFSRPRTAARPLQQPGSRSSAPASAAPRPAAALLPVHHARRSNASASAARSSSAPPPAAASRVSAAAAAVPSRDREGAHAAVPARERFLRARPGRVGDHRLRLHPWQRVGSRGQIARLAAAAPPFRRARGAHRLTRLRPLARSSAVGGFRRGAVPGRRRCGGRCRLAARALATAAAGAAGNCSRRRQNC